MTVRPTFGGARVLLLESRRGTEMAAIVTAYDGVPVVAPSMREVPLESNAAALDFADRLVRGGVDLVIFLTGVGARVLIEIVTQARGTREPFIEALRATRVAVRGPKPLAAMRELGVPVWCTAPEPNTWREMLAALDAGADDLRGLRIAVQEYGASSPELFAGLGARGAHVTPVPVYRWALPEDIGPLRVAIESLIRGDIEMVLVTASAQVEHLLLVAETMGEADAVRRVLAADVLVGSIGPTTTAELGRRGIPVAVQASHPKMGFLVREAAGAANRSQADPP